MSKPVDVSAARAPLLVPITLMRAPSSVSVVIFVADRFGILAVSIVPLVICAAPILISETLILSAPIDVAPMRSAESVPVLMFDAFIFVMLALDASIVPVVICPPFMTVVPDADERSVFNPFTALVAEPLAS